MKKIKASKYQLYILTYHIFFIGYVINSNVFRQEFFLVFLSIFTLLEIKNLYKTPKYIIVMWSISLFSIFSFLYRGVYINASLALYFSMLAVIVYSYNEKVIGFKVHLIPFIIFSLYVIINIIIGVDPNYILDGRSRNMVSFYTFMFASYYYIEKYRHTQKLELWPALIVLYVAILTTGRSGIIVATLLLLLVSYFKTSEASRLKKIMYLLVLFVLVIALFGGLYDAFETVISNKLTRFEERGFDSDERSAITYQYIASISEDITQLLFGSTLDNYIFPIFDYNLHNSFLSLHYFTGIFSIVVFILILKALFFSKGELFLRGLLFILLLRGTTDQIFFFNFNDVIIFYLLFFIIRKRKYINHSFNPRQEV